MRTGQIPVSEVLSTRGTPLLARSYLHSLKRLENEVASIDKRIKLLQVRRQKLVAEGGAVLAKERQREAEKPKA